MRMQKHVLAARVRDSIGCQLAIDAFASDANWQSIECMHTYIRKTAQNDADWSVLRQMTQTDAKWRKRHILLQTYAKLLKMTQIGLYLGQWRK